MAGLLALNLASVFVLSPGGQQRVKVPFSPNFSPRCSPAGVVSIASKGDTIQGTFTSPARYPPTDAKATPTTLFATGVPSFWSDDQLSALLRSAGVQVNAESTTQTTPLILSLLLGFGPTLLIVGLFILFARRAAKSGNLGALGNSGCSKARRIDPATIRITFADVAGIDEAKAELTEVVDFPTQPRALRPARRPHAPRRAALGRPRDGRDAAGAAVAGEALAAFFSISASEFIEAIVGVGASRVRDLFAKAKEAAPSIIFADELDAIGRSRQGSISIAGSNDEPRGAARQPPGDHTA